MRGDLPGLDARPGRDDRSAGDDRAVGAVRGDRSPQEDRVDRAPSSLPKQWRASIPYIFELRLILILPISQININFKCRAKSSLKSGSRFDSKYEKNVQLQTLNLKSKLFYIIFLADI